MIVENGKYYLYRHIRLDKDEPFYIGIGKKNKDSIYKRAFTSFHRNIFWKRVVSKHEYIVEIAFESFNKEDALNKEIELINKYGRKDLKLGTLTNLTDGGENGKQSEYSRKILSEKLKLFYSKNEGYLKGKNLPIEWKNNISKGSKGKVFTDEHKINLRNNTFVKKIMCIDTGKEYPSIIECIRDMFDGNLYKRKNIQQSIKKNTTYKGFTFKLI